MTVRALRTTAVAAAAAALVALLPAAAGAVPTARGNTYESDLPGLVDGPTVFEVAVSGPEQVCAMEYGTQTDDAAPWTFTWNPHAPTSDNLVRITLCSGGRPDFFMVGASLALLVDPTFVPAGTGKQTVRVRNQSYEDGTVKLVTDAGRTVAAVAAPAGRWTNLTVDTDRVTATTAYRVTLTAPGHNASETLTVSSGWSLFPDIATRNMLPYKQCEKVTWSFDPSGGPRGGYRKRVVEDAVADAVDFVAGSTNLTFARSGSRSGARLRVVWRKITTGEYVDAMATGHVDGTVTLNKRRLRISSNEGRARTYLRKLLIHEVLHTMGFDHARTWDSIMANSDVLREPTTVDYEAMRTVYPPGTCTA